MPLILNGSTGISGTDGTAATPALQGTDTNTGVFFPAADTIAFAEGGTEVMRINSAAQVEYVAGSAAAPTIVPAGDTNTGMFFPAADTIAFAEGGVEALRLNASGNAVFTGTVRAAGVAADIYPLVLGTFVASISGTSIDFTGIPSWVRRITVMFTGVSTNGTSNVLIQIGSGSVQTTGYAGAGAFGPTYSVSNYTTGFGLPIFSAASVFVEGAIVITNFSGAAWVAQGCVSRSDGAVAGTTAGRVTLAGTLDRVRITTVNGTDLFDAGFINIMYE